MKPWVRVDNTIKGLATDRVPFGEIFVDPLFCQRAMDSTAFSFSLAREFWEMLGLDLIVFHPGHRGDTLEEIFRWREKTDYYIFAIIGGGFSKGLETLGFSKFMQDIARDPLGARKVIRRFAGEELETGRRCVEAGAHAVMIGDDIAYQRGTYISPEQMRIIAFPSLREQVEELKGWILVFHSDGNLNAVLDDLLGWV